MNAGFAPDCCRSDTLGGTGQIDPFETFMTARRAASRSAENGPSGPVRPGSNDVRLKARTAVALLAILGWGGAKRARPSSRAQTRRDLRRRHCRLQPVDGAR